MIRRILDPEILTDVEAAIWHAPATSLPPGARMALDALAEAVDAVLAERPHLGRRAFGCRPGGWATPAAAQQAAERAAAAERHCLNLIEELAGHGVTVETEVVRQPEPGPQGLVYRRHLRLVAVPIGR